ncbi:MAG: DUF1697 domain-containing protein [Myxococcus sp.]|nr:DUF1697 domain-containing protein [Myxococcus sp.]
MGKPTGRARWLALLRGINVGGNNVISMADLRACVEALGFADVTTFIQSGNVLFSGPARQERVVKTLEAGLARRLGGEVKVVLLSPADLSRVVAEAPKGFGAAPDRYRYDVLFVRPTVSPAEVLAQVPTRPGVDAAWCGSRAVYFRRLTSRASQSRLSKLTQLSVYREVTLRNWNSTTRLAALLNASSSAPPSRGSRRRAPSPTA